MGKKKKELSNEIIHKEIDLIQACINRMAQNSFSCKGWNLTLIAGALALVPQNINRIYICIIVLGIDLCFWWLDSFFVLQERKYRAKYSWVIQNRIEGNKSYLYDLNPNNEQMVLDKQVKYTFLNMAKSKTLLPMYGGIAIAICAYMLKYIILK